MIIHQIEQCMVIKSSFKVGIFIPHINAIEIMWEIPMTNALSER